VRAITLHLFRSPDEVGISDVLLAAPGQSPEERVALWSGVPPRVPADDRLAPVVLVGEIDGRPMYAEKLPRGPLLSELEVPEALRSYVLAEVLQAVHALHQGGTAHGGVGASAVVLGEDGRVVLAGAGRQGGRETLDLFAALTLFPSMSDVTLHDAEVAGLIEEMRARAHEHAQEELALFVLRQALEPVVVAQAVLLVGANEDAVDEIVPDLGPERTDSHGILDRWAVTTTTGGDVTEEVSATSPGLAVTLWNRLLAPPEHPPPPDRFAQVEGKPSRAIIGLLTEQHPEILPLPVAAGIGAFVVTAPTWDDQPTMVDADPHTVSPAPAPRRQGMPVPFWVQWGIAMGVGGLIVYVVLWLLA
jgi:hypothetical protein